MPKLQDIPQHELLEKFPNFDKAWGSLYENLWALSYRLEVSGLFHSEVTSQIDGMFDALEGILHHYDVLNETQGE